MEVIGPDLQNGTIQTAVKNLFIYSILILLIPLASMFLLKNYLFEGIMGYHSRDSMTYSAITAVVIVHVVLFLWIKATWSDGKPIKED